MDTGLTSVVGRCWREREPSFEDVSVVEKLPCRIGAAPRSALSDFNARFLRPAAAVIQTYCYKIATICENKLNIFYRASKI